MGMNEIRKLSPKTIRPLQRLIIIMQCLEFIEYLLLASHF